MQNIDFDFFKNICYSDYSDNFSQEEHKSIISFVINNQDNKNLCTYDKYIYGYLEYYFFSISDFNDVEWFHTFTAQLLDSLPSINHYNLYFVIEKLICTDKDLFIRLLSKTKSFYFFQNSFDNFSYSEKEKEHILSFFGFTDNLICEYCYDSSYGLYRDIFDIFGIIPSILILSTNSSPKQRPFKFLVKQFNNFSIEIQAAICINSFFKTNKSTYKHFFKLLPEQNNNVIRFLQSKEKNEKENDFLNLSIPIAEEINNSINIQNF